MLDGAAKMDFLPHLSFNDTIPPNAMNEVLDLAQPLVLLKIETAVQLKTKII